MNRKKLRIVSLLIAAIKMMSLSGMALAYEDEDVVVDPIGIPELPLACGDGCADHDDGFTLNPIEMPAMPMLPPSGFDPDFGDDGIVNFNSAGICIGPVHFFPVLASSYKSVISDNHPIYCKVTITTTTWICHCGKTTKSNTDENGTPHKFVTSGHITVCNLCGYRK